MADPQPQTNPLISVVADLILQRETDIALKALVLYDWALTLDREISLVWKRDLHSATILFFLNRYLYLLRIPLNSIFLSPTATNIADNVLELGIFAVWSLFTSLRVYALTSKRVWLSVATFVISAVPLATNIYGATQSAAIPYPEPILCYFFDYFPPGVFEGLLIFTRVSAIATDGLVLIVTWLETFSSWCASKKAGLKTSLATLLLRDGTAYFLILFALNIIHLVCTLTGVFTTSVGTFVESFTTILISRFILNLRGFDRSGFRSALESQSSVVRLGRWSIPVGAAGDGLVGISARVTEFVAPLGAPLNDFCGLEMAPEAEGEGGVVEIDNERINFIPDTVPSQLDLGCRHLPGA